MMKVSIIIPFHRGIHFLADCFQSIREQGLDSFETVLVLDNIKEEIFDIVRSYHDLNIKIVELEKNPTACQSAAEDTGEALGTEDFLAGHNGAAAARNAGLAAALGEYIYFLDSDDYIYADTLPLLLKEAQEKRSDFVYGKKASSWFSRKVYLASQEEKAAAEIEEEQDDKGEAEDSLPEERLERLDCSEDAYKRLLASRKGFNDISILGILYHRGFLLENQLHFNENYIFYADISFLVLTLKHARNCSFVEDAIYVKRKHNDPIHYPALVQIKAEQRFKEMIAAYREAIALTEPKSALRRLMEEKLISYFTVSYAPKLRRSENNVWRTERFFILQDCMKNVDKELIRSLRKYKKRVVGALLQGNVTKATMAVNLHLGWKKLKKIRKNRRVFSYYLYFKFFLKMPVKENWVLCESFFGKSYSDSPKYIYEYLCKNYPGKYKFIWVLNKKTKVPFHPTIVKRFSIRYAYYLARCKYDLFNSRQPEWVRKREGNVFLETWHGTPLKKLVFDQEEVMAASPLYKAQFYKQSRIWDYLVSANHFSSEVFKRAFCFDKEILEFGYPRNDILYSTKKDELVAQIKQKLNIPAGKKTILYAPTWRDDEYYGKGQYKFSLQLDLRLLKEELGEDYVVLLRTHYFIADSLDVTGLENFAVNVSKYDDISELYLISDVLITDYSSVFFDYANLKRPILFYTYDLDKYRDMLRGFYMDIESEVPGPLLFSSEEVVDSIRHIDDIMLQYKDKYEAFYERFCSLDDGHAAEKVAKKVFHLE